MGTRKRSVGIFLAAFAGLVVAVSLAVVVDGAGGVASASDSTVVVREPMDLVWISDSSGWGVASFYARHIRKDLGVEVRVHDRWEADLAGAAVLSRLRTRGHEWLSLIRTAEIIFISANPVQLRTPTGGDCVSDLPKPPLAARQEDWSKYITGVKAMYKRIFEIRKGRPVILRTSNWYAPAIAQPPSSPFYRPISWKQAGLVDACTREFEMFAWAISEAAAAYHVRMADVYTAFNGKGHREDPVAKGYIQADGIHVNNKGRALFAKTLAKLGYKKVGQPH